VTGRHSRRTGLLRQMLERVALALGGRLGARMTHRLAAAVSRTALLQLIRALPMPEEGRVSMLGVDDFAFRKGSHYGSIVADMDTHRSVDLFRFTRSGAGVWFGLGRVDPPRQPRRRNAPCQPCPAINRSTRLRPTLIPSRRNC
jgi:hypothetical protein